MKFELFKRYCAVFVLLMDVVAGSDARSAASPSGASPSTGLSAAVPSAVPTPLDQAMQWVVEKNWPQAQSALQAIIDSKSFGHLASDIQYRTLAAAGRVGMYHGDAKRGYGYLKRAVLMTQADAADRLEQVKAALKLGSDADAIEGLTALAQRWPEQIKNIDTDLIVAVVNKSNHAPQGSALPLLQSLYGAHWKLKWDIEPSAIWRDLTLLLLEKGRSAEALDVSAHVTDVYVLITMRADRRFEPVVTANPAQFDIEAAADREFKSYQTASERQPRSLELTVHVLEALRHQQHYAAMLAASDAVIEDVESTNYPDKLFDDYDDQYVWILDERATALQRMSLWDEAVAQLSAASQVYESKGGDVRQLLDLAFLYCDLQRPGDALAAVSRVLTNTSPYGAMQMEAVRLDASLQLHDTAQAAKSMAYMNEHRADAPSAYQGALVTANQTDAAAKYLISRLQAPDLRQDALEEVQRYAPIPLTPRGADFYARWLALVARTDVQAAIAKVGRAESYRLEEE